jgi:signal peptidase I
LEIFLDDHQSELNSFDYEKPTGGPIYHTTHQDENYPGVEDQAKLMDSTTDEVDIEVGLESLSKEEDVDEPLSFRLVLIETIETLVLALVLFLAINTVTARIQVDGKSMEPSFQHRDNVIVNKLTYRFSELQRGDVVVFPYPHSPEEDYIKRVIGLPGDRLAIRDGQVYINEVPLNEPYIKSPAMADYPETTVPEGKVFVLGDNRNDSSDSRSWGPLPIASILGKAVFVYWPLPQIGTVDQPETVFAAP